MNYIYIVGKLTNKGFIKKREDGVRYCNFHVESKNSVIKCTALYQLAQKIFLIDIGSVISVEGHLIDQKLIIDNICLFSKQEEKKYDFNKNNNKEWW